MRHVSLRRFVLALSLGSLLASGCGGAARDTRISQTSVPATVAPTSTQTALPTIAPSATQAPLPTWTPVPTAEAGAIRVDPGTVLGPVNPLVYGTNYGPWISVPVDLTQQALDSGITLLRFPGGAYGDQNDLREAQVDQFIKLADQMGAEPLFCVRLAGGTPLQAAEWVRYANVQNDYNIRYWSIGNEPTLYATGFKMEGYDTEAYNREWRQYAEAMKEVDPSILLVGPDTNQFQANLSANPKDPSGRDWMEEFLTQNGDLVDLVAIHRYPFPAGKSASVPTIADLRANALEWDSILPALRQLIRDKTGRDIPVAVTEVSSSWSRSEGGEATPDSFYNAIWWSDVLTRMIRQDVEVVAYFVLQSTSVTGAWGLLARYEVRPTYYVYQMFKQFGSQQVQSTSGDADVSVVAALREDGALTVMLTNRAPEEKSLPVRIAGLDADARVDVVRFDETHEALPVGEMSGAEVEAMVLPGASITLLVIE